MREDPLYVVAGPWDRTLIAWCDEYAPNSWSWDHKNRINGKIVIGFSFKYEADAVAFRIKFGL